MRKRVLVYSAVGTAGLLVSSVAVVAQPFDWAGPYIGASIGVVYPDGTVPLNYPAGVSEPDTVYFDDNAPIFSGALLAPIDPIAWPAAASLASSGHLVTLNAGYNLQQGVVVYGAEIDASFFSGTTASWTTGVVDDSTNLRTHGVTVSGGIDQLYSIRPRVGVTVDRLLLFGTAGLALGHADLDTLAYFDNGYGPGHADWQGGASDWRLGVIVGAGAEYALTDQLSVKLEALHYNLGKMTATAEGSGTYSGAPVDVAPYTATLDLSGFSVRGGFNLRF